MQQVTHIDSKVERLQEYRRVWALRPPEEGPSYTTEKNIQAYNTIYTMDGERGGIRKKSINA